jgi:glycosyltransferase involved in cell wall biosynthesis
MKETQDNTMRVVIFGTHVKQFNGYSKVVYELSKAMSVKHSDIKLHVFGFQNFHNHPGHRLDVPPSVDMYDAHAEEVPKAAGFGVPLVKSYVARVKPDVCIVFNDLMVLTSVLNELKDAPNRKSFKVLAYVDQVYLCQRKDLLEFVNQNADAAIAFTDHWRDCIKWQGLRLPCHVLPHGINAMTYFPVPKKLARRFFGLPESDFLVLNLNRNQPRKRWDTCLQAFAEVVRRLPDKPVKLVIGTDLKGAWDLMELYERELKKRGIPVKVGMDRLVVPGHPQLLTDEETNILYNVADIGINTCDGEGFGLCNFEQAAIGIPQVVPRLGGFMHFFDEETALMVEPKLSIYVDSMRDGVGGEAQLAMAEHYADAIVKYYEDAALRARHGIAARSKIIGGFGWDKIADQLHAILRETLPAGTTEASDLEPSGAVSEQSKVPAADVERMLRGCPESSNAQQKLKELKDSPSPDIPKSNDRKGTHHGTHHVDAPLKEETPGRGEDARVKEIRALRERLDALLAETIAADASGGSS